MREAVGDGPAYARARQILLLGELNPLGDSPRFALYPSPVNSTGWRLCEQIFGLPEDQYLAMWRANLCVGWWQNDHARVRAKELTQQVGRHRQMLLDEVPEVVQEKIKAELELETPWRVVVMLGRKVADACLRAQSQFLRFDSMTVKSNDKTLTYVSLPHPSGRCREWNDPRMAITTRTIMRELAPEMDWRDP